ncbi:hypothetical protein GXP67_26940 [Rhodocytophaga rosea]|uniref:Uncharacterized protein n=1 Tax=Rhodocytophaga rosea TaxID=2704465 RepID=A0A6C0GR34_9BACT|nr:hypothetical protein [Rhodocytophaga rosea]QHT70022.1 hypothetical protein GXP67_26940 [Rhodocytophaga rosea]
MTKNIDRKNLFVVGKSAADRQRFVDNIVATTNKVVYRFPPNIRSFDNYIEQVRRLFPFVPTNWHEQNPKKWTRNQVWDFHLDWTNNTHSILIVIEEFGKMEENWEIEIIRDYLQKSYYQEQINNPLVNFQLIVTQEEDEGIVEKLSAIFGLKENEKRTSNQVISGKLQVINLELL